MSRRAKGEGSVYYDDSRDRYVGQADAGLNPSTGKRRRVKVIGQPGESKASVAKRLRERIDHLQATTAAPETVGQLVESWLARGAPKRKGPSSMATARNLVDKHIMPTFARVKVTAVTVEDIEAWLDELAGNLSRATVMKIRSQLAQAFDFGLRRRHVTWNPARIAEIPTTGAESKRQPRSLTGPEARALLNVADDHRVGAWVTVALSMGLRPGEVSGLTWDALDLDAGVMVIHQALAWPGPILKPTKTERPRTLDLPPRVVEALRRHRKRSAEERLLMGDRWPMRWADLVFVTTNGTPLGATNIRRIVSRMADEAGIEGTVAPYDLRHTATSLLSAAGVAPELLADLLGHVDTRMVFKHYRHPVTPRISTAAEHIDQALGL